MQLELKLFRVFCFIFGFSPHICKDNLYFQLSLICVLARTVQLLEISSQEPQIIIRIMKILPFPRKEPCLDDNCEQQKNQRT